VTYFPGWSEKLNDEVIDVTDELWRRGWTVQPPSPSVTYDLGFRLPLADRWPADLEPLVTNFYANAMAVVRCLTPPGEHIYALDCEYEGYLLWPHETEDGAPWPELGLPAPDNGPWFMSCLLPRDFAWGLVTCAWEVTVCGRARLDAFERDNPLIFRNVIAVDGVPLTKPLDQ